ncbi:major facilitator superfamily domain-containing protein [Kalaharituber pfeilii]|nr:major facilitator superfamily domain-containing protein [Kalaharituber pfeilii]
MAGEPVDVVAPSTASRPRSEEEATLASVSLEPRPEPSKVQWRPTAAVYIIIVTLCIITLGIALDATSLSVALPIMAEKLGGSAIEAFWSGTSFLLTQTVFQPSYAAFSHIFGRKPLMLIALVLFTAGSIIAAVANNFTVIIIGRSIQGFGAGGVISLTEIVFTDIVPLRERGKYFGFMQMMWAIGSVTGPIVGGSFAQEVSWRWIFYINLPFSAIGFILVPIFLKLHYKAEDLATKLKRVDWVGTFLFIASATSQLIPLTWGGVMYPWDHWRTLVPLLLGSAGLVAFVFYEIYVPAEPMVRLSIFKNRTTVVNYAGTAIHGTILWCLLYYLPLYYEGVKDLSPVMSGVACFPLTLTIAPISIVIGVTVSVTGRFRWAIWLGWVLATAGAGILVLLEPQTTTVQWIFMTLTIGLGTGILFPGTMMAVQSSVRSEDVSYAVAMFSFFRSWGQSFGVAIGGVIFQNSLERELRKFPLLKEIAGEYAKDAVAVVQVIKKMPHGTPGREELVHSYAEALQVVWMALIGFSALGLILSLFTEKRSLDRELNTEHGLRTKDEKRKDKLEGQ